MLVYQRVGNPCDAEEGKFFFLGFTVWAHEKSHHCFFNSTPIISNIPIKKKDNFRSS